jgi:uncharacterized YigZ family protein
VEGQPAEPSSYLTIARPGDAEIEVKRSRFLARLRRVTDEPGAREVVDRARKEHWDAGHHCSAFVLGPDGATMRSHDDGEPGGTAGAPMLEVLRGHGLSDVVAVVTRYFGGTLLGAGGLVRAYSEAVRMGLEEEGVVRRQRMQLVELLTTPAGAGRLEHDLRSRDVVVRGVSYADPVVVTAAVPVTGVENLRSIVAALTSGEVSLRPTATEWVDLPG